MTTPLPEPTPLIKLHMATGIVNYYTEAQLKAYVAKREKTLAAALQAMTAERDDALYAGRLIVQRCDRLVAERDALKADAERYRWIVKHAGWYRNDEDDLRDNSTKLAINVAYGADLSCEAMRDLAIENAMKGKS